MTKLDSIDQYLTAHAERFVADLCELLRIPSVSADSKHKSDVERAARWVAGQFEKLKFKTEVVQTAGHPIVYAESPAVAGASARTPSNCRAAARLALRAPLASSP